MKFLVLATCVCMAVAAPQLNNPLKTAAKVGSKAAVVAATPFVVPAVAAARAADAALHTAASETKAVGVPATIVSDTFSAPALAAASAASAAGSEAAKTVLAPASTSIAVPAKAISSAAAVAAKATSAPAAVAAKAASAPADAVVSAAAPISYVAVPGTAPVVATAVATGRALINAHDDFDAKVISYVNDVRSDSYNYGFKTSNGISAEAEGAIKEIEDKVALVSHGKYEYIDENGNPVVVTYIADENGYQPQSDFLPTPPPMPKEIAAALEYIKMVRVATEGK